MAAARARQISSGEEPTLPEDRDKNPVIALREIAEPTIAADDLRETVIQGMQRHIEVDEPEEDELETQMFSQLFSDNVDETRTAEAVDEVGNDEVAGDS